MDAQIRFRLFIMLSFDLVMGYILEYPWAYVLIMIGIVYTPYKFDKILMMVFYIVKMFATFTILPMLCFYALQLDIFIIVFTIFVIILDFSIKLAIIINSYALAKN